MSQFHYIASPVELDTGSFGGNKTVIHKIEIVNPHLIRINDTKDVESYFPIEKTESELMKELEVYDTEEDAVGIFVSKTP